MLGLTTVHRLTTHESPPVIHQWLMQRNAFDHLMIFRCFSKRHGWIKTAVSRSRKNMDLFSKTEIKTLHIVGCSSITIARKNMLWNFSKRMRNYRWNLNLLVEWRNVITLTFVGNFEHNFESTPKLSKINEVKKCDVYKLSAEVRYCRIEVENPQVNHRYGKINIVHN